MKDAARKLELNMTYAMLHAKWKRRYDKGHWPGKSVRLFKQPVMMGCQKHEFVMIKASEDSMKAKCARALAARE